jgi:hypothetical protein
MVLVTSYDNQIVSIFYQQIRENFGPAWIGTMPSNKRHNQTKRLLLILSDFRPSQALPSLHDLQKLIEATLAREILELDLRKSKGSRVTNGSPKHNKHGECCVQKAVRDVYPVER